MCTALGVCLQVLAVALVAVVWAVVLVDTDMLLAPVQKRFREWHRRWWLRQNPAEESGVLALNKREQQYYAGNNLDSRWWWKPLWGCERCCAGWTSLLGYLLVCWHWQTTYDPLLHLVTICASIYLAAILAKIYTWSQQ